MTKESNINLLSKGSIPHILVKLGIPTMIGMMVSALYNLVDTYFVGTLGTSQQAAVSAVFPISLIMLGIGLLFGSGAGSLLSRLLGKGEKQKADECASTAIGLAVVTAVVLVVIMLVAINPILHLLGCSDTMMPYAREYAIPFIIGLVINVFNSTLSNLASAEGSPVYSMRSMLLGGIVNVILDPVLIIGFNMGVFGAALATLIARLVSLISYLFYIFKKKSVVNYSIHKIHVNKKYLIEISKIGVPTCVFQILSSVALFIMNNLAEPYGDSAIAACGIVSRLITLGMMIVMGFMKGYMTFAGYNYGAGNHQRVRTATKMVLLWSTIFTVVSCIGIIVFRTKLVEAFNPNDSEVLDIGTKALVLNAVTFLTVGFQVVYSTKFMALGRAMDGGLISLGRQGFFFIPAVYILTSSFGLNGLIAAQPVADILSMILVCVLAYKDHIRENKLILQGMEI